MKQSIRHCLLTATLVMAACSTTQTVVTPAPEPLKSSAPPTDVTDIPNAVPRNEPLSKRGNPAFYEVLGQRYFVLRSAAGYVERGVASWYGPGFHAASTSNGERYDMYAMTAAHKTLPLPAYVQVTNLENGKSVVLRVNDRGPFKAGRIIDLSWTAASKLDMLKKGTGFVEVRALTPNQQAAPTASDSTLFVQAGAFGEAGNAERLAQQLRQAGHSQAFVRNDVVSGRSLYRVRIGPITNVAAFDGLVAQLKKLGIADAHLALD